MFILLIALVLSMQPHDCHLHIRPQFGPDTDSPAGVGVDGVWISTKCLF